MSHPPKTLGMRHIALNVFEVSTCVDFYTKVMGMTIEWQPDEDNVYLTSGNDNLAIHRVEKTERQRASQRLDHIGFFVQTAKEVDQWHDFLIENHVTIVAKPKTHRDGARSLYCKDPDGTVVQIIHHLPINA